MHLEKDAIVIRGAREHNLKNINCVLPRNQLIVVTGLSGSGKSSLVFDTVFAEAQRRFLESMSTYARYFLEQMKRPEVEVISGLQPTIAIDQKTGSLNPRSTVGTVTEAYDFLRLLFARCGAPLCPVHHLPLQSQSLEQIQSEIESKTSQTKYFILAPIAQQKKGEFSKEILVWQKMGIQKARIDGKWVELVAVKKLAKTKPHDIELVIDQLILKPSLKSRLKEALRRSADLAKGQIIFEDTDGQRQYFSVTSSCPECGFSFPEIDPRFFSFNSPKGACPDCKGLGSQDLSEEEVTSFEGDRSVLQSMRYKNKSGEVLTETAILSVCSSCQGTRLRSEALNVLVEQKNISELSQWEITQLLDWLVIFKASNANKIVIQKITTELIARLTYLVEVGCGYLSLARSTDSLSGGEAQRLRLASQLGSHLTGILYVLDEPSIGLHPRDHHKLLKILKQLRDAGNTVLVVEHDEETILSADYVIDVGPKAGRLGGEIISQGTVSELINDQNSLTAKYLSGALSAVVTPLTTRKIDQVFELQGATGNNLKNVTIKLPIGHLISVTGPSGSGKSTLIMDTLYPALAQSLGLVSAPPAAFKQIKGADLFDKIIEIDQKPIGRTSRSTPLTYVDLATLVRDVFSKLPEAKIRGFEPNRFSYNSKVGQCANCSGAGVIKLEMNFLSDVEIKCEVCNGKRFNQETLNIRYKSQSIADVLAMTVREAYEFFISYPLLRRKLETLLKVGLDYIQLGQGAPTLSGGEAQRIKLAKELSKKSTGKTIYILDEPTTGLHFEDVRLLTELLQSLVDGGNTVVVIEHNMDLIASSDWIIEMGPEGGNAGGQVIFQGAVADFIKKGQALDSPTWPFLKTKFER